MLLFVAFAVTMFAVACSSSSASDEDLPPADEVLSNARTAIAEVDQFEFELTHPRGKTALDGGLELRRAEGTVISPSRLSVSAEADLGRLFVKVDAVVIGGETWMTNPVTGNWSSIPPDDSPFSFLDPIRLVSNILAQTTDPVYPEDGGRDGDRIRLEGKAPSEAFQPLVGTVLPGEVLEVAMTIDAGTFLLTSATLRGRLQSEDESDATRLITLSGFDSELTIEPPI